jgi:adenylate kinase family enzyme
VRTNPQKAAHAAHASSFFAARLRETVSVTHSAKLANAQLDRYAERGRRLEEQEAERLRQEKLDADKLVRERRAEIREREAANRDAFRDFERRSKVDHDALQRTQRKQREAELRFKESQIASKVSVEEARRARDRADVLGGIDDFAKNLANAEARRQAEDLARASAVDGDSSQQQQQQQGNQHGQGLHATGGASNPADHIRTLKSRLPPQSESAAAAAATLDGIKARARDDRVARKARAARRRALLAASSSAAGDAGGFSAASASSSIVASGGPAAAAAAAGPRPLSRPERRQLSTLLHASSLERGHARELRLVAERRDRAAAHRTLRAAAAAAHRDAQLAATAARAARSLARQGAAVSASVTSAYGDGEGTDAPGARDDYYYTHGGGGGGGDDYGGEFGDGYGDGASDGGRGDGGGGGGSGGRVGQRVAREAAAERASAARDVAGVVWGCVAAAEAAAAYRKRGLAVPRGVWREWVAAIVAGIDVPDAAPIGRIDDRGRRIAPGAEQYDDGPDGSVDVGGRAGPGSDSRRQQRRRQRRRLRNSSLGDSDDGDANGDDSASDDSQDLDGRRDSAGDDDARAVEETVALLDEFELADYLCLDGVWAVEEEDLAPEEAERRAQLAADARAAAAAAAIAAATGGGSRGGGAGKRGGSSSARPASPRGGGGGGKSASGGKKRASGGAGDDADANTDDGADGGAGSAGPPVKMRRRLPAFNTALAAIVSELDDIVDPPPAVADPDPLPPFPVRVAVTGAPHAGRTTVARSLAARFGVAVIDPTALVAEAVACRGSQERMDAAVELWERHTAKYGGRHGGDQGNSDGNDDGNDNGDANDHNNNNGNNNGNGNNGNNGNGNVDAAAAAASLPPRAEDPRNVRMRRPDSAVLSDGRHGRPIAVDPEVLAATGAALHKALAAGKPAPDDAVAQLVAAAARAVDSRRGFVIDAFPATRAQAELLEHALTGLALPGKGGSRSKSGKPSKGSKSGARGSTIDPKGTLAAAAAEARARAEAAGLPADPADRRGLDLVIALSARAELCLARCAGARVDPVTGDAFTVAPDGRVIAVTDGTGDASFGGSDGDAADAEVDPASLVRPAASVAAEAHLPARRLAHDKESAALAKLLSEEFESLAPCDAEGSPRSVAERASAMGMCGLFFFLFFFFLLVFLQVLIHVYKPAHISYYYYYYHHHHQSHARARGAVAARD